MLTKEEFARCLPHLAANKVNLYYLPMTQAMHEFGITTPVRIAAWLAQVAHESAELRYMKEIASGREYEGRRDLGNTHKGDGMKYKGRGPLQITGEYMYSKCGKALGLNLVEHPELLELPAHACRASAWFWETHGLNVLADHDTLVSFRGITHKVNGGENGEADREAYWKNVRRVLGLPAI